MAIGLVVMTCYVLRDKIASTMGPGYVSSLHDLFTAIGKDPPVRKILD